MNYKKLYKRAAVLMAAICVGSFYGCAGTNSVFESSSEGIVDNKEEYREEYREETSQEAGKTESSNISSGVGTVDFDEIFTNRDLKNDCVAEYKIYLSDNSSSSDNSSVKISGNEITIKEAGIYLVSGNLNNGVIIIDAGKDDKVQLILDGVNMTSESSAAIFSKKCDKLFITTAEGSTNTLSVIEELVSIDDDSNVDGVIFSKTDLTLNGLGTLSINSTYGHGIVSKDSLKVTGGTYNVNSGRHAFSGKDELSITGSEMQINALKKGLQSEGVVNLFEGNYNINAGTEGIEGLAINIFGGLYNITAMDDGINASAESSGSGNEMMGNGMQPVSGCDINISGGLLNIYADGDGIDSNGDVYVSGGEVYIYGPENSGNGALDYNGEAVITGGIFVALGASGMAENFSGSSTQGAILVNVKDMGSGTTSLYTDDGTEIVTVKSDKKYNSVLISSPLITVGSTYKLNVMDEEITVTMDSIIYGNFSGGPGGNGGPGGFGGPGNNEGEFGGPGNGEFGGPNGHNNGHGRQNIEP